MGVYTAYCCKEFNGISSMYWKTVGTKIFVHFPHPSYSSYCELEPASRSFYDFLGKHSNNANSNVWLNAFSEWTVEVETRAKEFDIDHFTGRYKQWTGLLEWNTGLDYRTELISFIGQDSVFVIGIFSIQWYPFVFKCQYAYLNRL